jgi:hypothetical protein
MFIFYDYNFVFHFLDELMNHPDAAGKPGQVVQKRKRDETVYVN